MNFHRNKNQYYRFTDKTIKDSILSNYENDMDMDMGQNPGKLFEDLDEECKIVFLIYL